MADFIGDLLGFGGSVLSSALEPAAIAAANIAILEYQKDQFDDIDDRRRRIIDAGLGGWNTALEAILQLLPDAIDKVPEPAMYQPVSPAGEQWQTIQDNTQMLGIAQNYNKQLTQLNLDADQARAIIMNPKHFELSEITWLSIGQLIQGEIPIGKTVAELTRSAEQNFGTGRLGRHCGNYRRNLGILDYEIQKAGRAEQRQERASFNQDVSSLQKSGDIRELMQTPQQRLSLALQQAQFLQNSLQNANNAAAKADPFLFQQVLVQLERARANLQTEISKAGMLNGFVPDFASVIGDQVSDLTNAVITNSIEAAGNSGGDGGGGGGLLGAVGGVLGGLF